MRYLSRGGARCGGCVDLCGGPLRADVSILGEIPSGLLGFEDPLSGLDSGTQATLMASAITLALVGYMEVGADRAAL